MDCPACGHELHVVEQRSVLERGWAWFHHGPPVWRRRFSCRSCDFAGTDRSFSSLYRSTGSFGILRRWRDFQFSRRFFPVPRFYVVLAVAGAAIGVALRVTVGWPWWVPTLGLPLGGWVWAASSAIPRQ